MSKEKKIDDISGKLPAEETIDRRAFLLGLKKWSKVVIGLALAGTAGFADRGR